MFNPENRSKGGTKFVNLVCHPCDWIIFAMEVVGLILEDFQPKEKLSGGCIPLRLFYRTVFPLCDLSPDPINSDRLPEPVQAFFTAVADSSVRPLSSWHILKIAARVEAGQNWILAVSMLVLS